jgi:deoxyribodipyrimidine photo-lyase
MIIYWHKRDYRLLDNEALNLGLELARNNHCEFVPIMGLETNLIEDIDNNYEFDSFHQVAIINAAIPLYNNYQFYNIKPYMFYDSILHTLSKLNSIKPITYLISYQEHGTSFTHSRDKEVSQYCKANNIIWIELQPSSIVRALNTRDNRDQYWKQYVNSPILPIPDFKNLKTPEFEDQYSTILELQNTYKTYKQLAKTSEKNGLLALQDFVNTRALKYKGSISSPNTAIEFGSRLSQYIAYGSLSIRYIVQNFWASINEAKSSGDKKRIAGILGAMTRLHWREHFIQRLEDEPSMANTAINIDYDKIQYCNNPEYIKAVKTGHTGEPLIDACIRCLNQTGFINFRMRAMLVSYATFALDIDWRIIGRILAVKFLDYEPGIHWSQIQMQAGITGINSIRVYSPHKQLIDQDPLTIFIKKWIPELVDIEPKDILRYDKISLSDLTSCNYPDRICDTNQCIKINKAKLFEIKKQKTSTAKAVYVKHGSRKKVTKKIKKKTLKTIPSSSTSLF